MTSSQNDRIVSWLRKTNVSILTPPSENEPRLVPLRRKRRAVSLPSNAPVSDLSRGSNAKRQRIDEIHPEQSASQFEGDDAISLTKVTTFSLPISRISSNAKRSSSPSRESPILLRSASPPVLTESLNGLKEPPPEHVEQLGDRLSQGIDFGFIPSGLIDVIKGDSEVGHQSTRSTDFDHNDTRPPHTLSAIWELAKDIFLGARECKDNSRDENAWRYHVLQPLLRLAAKLYGNGKLRLESVQSQTINPAYLSTIPAPNSLDPSRRKTIDRKTDFCFSYSPRHPTASTLYEKLDAANKREISHTLDISTTRTALFSGLEVKASSGDLMTAELQMSIWIAASLRKKRELAYAAFKPSAMVEPSLAIVGHAHSIYYAYWRDDLVSNKGGIHILGPDDDRFGALSTNSIRGIFRLARVYGNILEYGSGEGENGYWGQFLGPVLNALTST